MINKNVHSAHAKSSRFPPDSILLVNLFKKASIQLDFFPASARNLRLRFSRHNRVETTSFVRRCLLWSGAFHSY